LCSGDASLLVREEFADGSHAFRRSWIAFAGPGWSTGDDISGTAADRRLRVQYRAQPLNGLCGGSERLVGR
jgi:hypothetical protein